MALKVWLKLNGNLKNSGLKKMSFTNIDTVHTSYDGSNGVYGGSYANNSFVSGGVISNETIFLGQNHSMFCWFRFKTLNQANSLGAGLVTQHRYENNRGTGITIKYVTSTTGYLSVNTGNGSSRTYNTYCGTTLLQANTWYHGGFTYDGQYIRIYVNGVCEKVQEYPNMSVVDDNIALFCWSLKNNSSVPHPNYKLNGNLDDVRIYDNCLTDYDVERIYSNNNNFLVLSFPLNKNFRNIGLVNAKTSKIGNASIIEDQNFGGCLQAGNGTQITNGVRCNTNLLNELSGQKYSCSIWVRPKGNHVHYNGTFFSSGNWNNKCWAFGVNDTNTHVDMFGPKYSTYVSCVIPLNEWTHLISTYDNKSAKLYKNGEFVTGYTFPYSYVFSSDTTYCAIGRETYADGYFSFNGNIAKLNVYNLVLTDTDVKRLYKNEEIILLPTEYKKLEYIQSTGTQYIDTNVKISSSNVKYNIKFQMTAESSSFCPFGTEYNNGSSNARWGGLFYGYNKAALYIGTQAHGGKWTFTTNTDYDLSLDINNGNFTTTLNGSSISGTYNGEIINDLNVTVGLFGLNRINKNSVVTRGVYTSSTKMKLYHFKIIESGIVKFNGIPSKRKSDDVIGMYDIVSKQFFTNSGTGSFTGA